MRLAFSLTLVVASVLTCCCNRLSVTSEKKVTLLSAEPQHALASVVIGGQTFTFQEDWCECTWDLALLAKGQPLCTFARVHVPPDHLTGRIEILPSAGQPCTMSANDLWRNGRKNTLTINCHRSQEQLLFLALLCAVSRKEVDPNASALVKMVARLQSSESVAQLASALLAEWNYPLASPVFSTPRPLGSLQHHYEVCGEAWHQGTESLVMDASIRADGTVISVFLVNPVRSDWVNRLATEELATTLFRPAGIFDRGTRTLRFQDGGVFRLAASVHYTGKPCPQRD